MLMLVGLCHPVIIAMVLLSFVDSLVFTTASQSYLESHDVQMFEIHEGESPLSSSLTLHLTLKLTFGVSLFSFLKMVNYINF